ncbi:tRNA pseudouridine synthase A [Astathelohania contejeani]|uniref:tRNA pseudouridine synthase A n=1 Tax=Astathelohania contejeani TaxID=164912 RepID=A0ABQ7I0Y9_9MICR|nr:tRNA pseudouridine synthase A [Thelohania contejeani]
MKIKVAFIIGYNGKKYHGLQFNQSLPTIEGVLIDELRKIKAISELNAIHPRKIGMQRACRTDKGVHAAMNIITCKIEFVISDECFEKLRESLLLSGIYLYKIVRVPRGFVPKNRCDSRVYEYFIPTFILEKENFNENCKIYNNKKDNEIENNIDTFIKYRISDENYKKIKNILESFKGVKNYHNFTAQNNTKGTSRIIKSITVSDPLLSGEVEYIRISLHGQSFMLHQIRKMIGLAVIAHKYCSNPEEVMDMSFGGDRINIPKAPSCFLLLDEPFFTYYNDKYKLTHPEIVISKDERESIKNKIIYPEILKKENLFSFIEWKQIIYKHYYEFKYIN